MIGDGAQHLAWINEIVSYEHIPADLFYPFLHIFLAELVTVTQLDLIVLHKIVPVLFGCLFILFMFTFSRLVFPKGDGAPLLVFLISCSFILNCTLLAPNRNSYLIIPFILMLYVMGIKRESVLYYILLVLVILAVVIYHPLSAIIIGLVMSVMCLSILLVPRLLKNPNVVLLNDRISIPAVVLLGVVYFIWLFQFKSFESTIANMVDVATLERSEQYAVIGKAIENTAVTRTNPFVEIVRRYGQQILIIALASTGAIYLFLYDRLSQDYRTLRTITFPFFAIIAFMITMVGVQSFTISTRYLGYIVIIGILLCAYIAIKCILNLKEKVNIKSVAFIIVVIGTICGIMTLGIMSVYPSPLNSQGSLHTTKMSVSGMKWFFDHRDIGIPLTGISLSPGNFAFLLLTRYDREKQNLPIYMVATGAEGTIYDARPPVHFGYRNSLSLGDHYDRETDLIINTFDEEYYSVTRPELGEFYWQIEDFERLSTDPKVSKVFDNSEYRLLKVIPHSSEPTP